MKRNFKKLLAIGLAITTIFSSMNYNALISYAEGVSDNIINEYEERFNMNY